MDLEQQAAATFSALGGAWPLSFVIDGKPQRKQRPRVTRGGARTYTPDKDREVALGLQLRRHVRRPLVGEVVLVCVFWMPDRTNTDFDNLVKQVADAGNGIMYADDKQVTGSAQLVELDRKAPRTLVMIGPRVGGTMGR